MLVERIRRFFAEYKEPRFRDKRGWYASGLLSNARDLYWAATGEKETNPTDLTGNLRMLVGKAIERELTEKVLNNLHWFGLHAFGGSAQIPIGGSDPAVDGYLDGLLVERSADGSFGKPWVLEVKVKTGFGADLFKAECNPGPEYLAQMGYYLRDLSAKGKTDRGIFLFVLVSDKSFGEMIEVECKYDQATETVTAYKATHIGGDEKALNFSLEMKPVLARLRAVEQAVRSGVLPPSEHRYKHPLTPAFLASVSDAQLKKACDGQKVLGDWQIQYSRYKEKHLEAEGTQLGYSDAELRILCDEYKRRKPRSKVGANLALAATGTED